LLSTDELIKHIRGCGQNNRESQKKIFSAFYGYAMAICIRYATKHEDADEIVNDGFLKIFKEIDHFTPAYADVSNSFKGWMRKIMIFTAIDHNRKFHKYEMNTFFNGEVVEATDRNQSALDKMSYNEIIKAIQMLSPAYRTILNLFIIDGFSHEEIAKQLQISVGTSKSNLSKAKKQLQKILLNFHQPSLIKNANR
jgi:RNA polymerase sigma factor (sigma-70 family)